jgi:DNA repair protein RadC
MSSPQAVKDHLRLEIWTLEQEVFCVLFLDAQHRIIALKRMFRGTVSQTSVYLREVVKEALAMNSGGSDPGSQPPFGRGRTEPCRRVLDADVEGRAVAGRRAGARSPGGGGR